MVVVVVVVVRAAVGSSPRGRGRRETSKVASEYGRLPISGRESREISSSTTGIRYMYNRVVWLANANLT